MRISTRGRYALRAMIDLALHTEAGPVLRQDISTRQEISADYVAQLFRQLCAAGLLEGVKGPGGGYRLAREVETIRAGDVVRAVEGPVALVHCTLPATRPPVIVWITASPIDYGSDCQKSWQSFSIRSRWRTCAQRHGNCMKRRNEAMTRYSMASPKRASFLILVL